MANDKEINWSIVVGNLGTVWQHPGGTARAAHREFRDWVSESRSPHGGRAKDEPVCLFRNGEIEREYTPVPVLKAKLEADGRTVKCPCPAGSDEAEAFVAGWEANSEDRPASLRHTDYFWLAGWNARMAAVETMARAIAPHLLTELKYAVNWHDQLAAGDIARFRAVIYATQPVLELSE